MVLDDNYKVLDKVLLFYSNILDLYTKPVCISMFHMSTQLHEVNSMSTHWWLNEP